MERRQKRQKNVYRAIKRLDTRIEALNDVSDRLAGWRLGVIGVGLPLLLILLFTNYSALFIIILLLTFGLFIGLLVWHQRVKYHIQRFEIWSDIKRTHLARTLLKWQHIPPPVYSDNALHPLEVDLDLRRLHHLLDTSISREGSRRLLDWLVPIKPHLGAIQQRQALVQELTPLTTFRDKLRLNAQLASPSHNTQPDAEFLRSWMQDDDQDNNQARGLTRMVTILGVLAMVNAILLVLSLLDVVPPVWGITWAIYAVLYITQSRTIANLFGESSKIAATLRRVDNVMRHIESHHFGKQPQLAKLVEPIQRERPSKQLRHIMTTVTAASLQGNPYLWFILNALMPWDLYFVRRLNRQKAVLAHVLPQWLDIWYELEALSALATFGYLNPDYAQPVLSTRDEAIFTARQIGHPLIPHTERVNNDFAFQRRGETYIITGSNMSGKSSFLRTLGVNLCLAYAGGVVAADALQTQIFRVFTSIRVNDSLDDGISYFYAEVKRLKDLLDALHKRDDRPLFYLIDEIFRGTNNRERLIGSRSFIDALVGNNGVGLIATHDLELTQLADEDTRIHNVHFREHIDAGQMIFDYTLRPGPCPTTNALTIMALQGLPVGDGEIDIPVNVTSSS